MPKAILVHLYSETGRRTELLRRGKTDAAQILDSDAANVKAATKNDFEKHFKLCPVYYFTGSETPLQVGKTLLGKAAHFDGTPLTADEISAVDTSFFIVQYEEAGTSQKGHVTPLLEGLVVMDHQGELVSSPMRFHVPSPTFLFFNSNADRRYNYSSKAFNIGYHEVAGKFQKVLEGYYGK